MQARCSAARAFCRVSHAAAARRLPAADYRRVRVQQSVQSSWVPVHVSHGSLVINCQGSTVTALLGQGGGEGRRGGRGGGREGGEGRGQPLKFGIAGLEETQGGAVAHGGSKRHGVQRGGRVPPTAVRRLTVVAGGA
jgi:hypothetical protein